MALHLSIFSAMLSVLLLAFNWRLNKNSAFLALFFLIFASYGITHYFFVHKHSVFWAAVFYNHFSPSWLLAGPMLYFYVRGNVSDKTGLSRSDAWHFVPAVLHLINILPYVLKPFAYKLSVAQYLLQNLNRVLSLNVNWIYPPVVSFIERTALLLIYCAYVFWLLYRAAPAKQNFSSKPYHQYVLSYRWMFSLNCIVSCIAVGFFFLLLRNHLGLTSASFLDSEPFYYLISVAFVLLPLSLLIYPQVLYGMPALSTPASFNEVQTAKNTKNRKKTNRNDATFDEPFQTLAEEIMVYLENKKPYLNPDFSLTDISIALKVPQHHVSYCFNTVFKVKFTQFKNQLRVAYAKELLLSGMANELSIEGIAQEAGFASRSNFYSAFKAEMGITPNEFLTKQSQYVR